MKKENVFIKAFSKKMIQDSIVIAIGIIIFVAIALGTSYGKLTKTGIIICTVMCLLFYVFLVNLYLFSDKQAVKKWYKYSGLCEDHWFYHYGVPRSCGEFFKEHEKNLNKKDFEEFEDRIFLFPLFW